MLALVLSAGPLLQAGPAFASDGPTSGEPTPQELAAVEAEEQRAAATPPRPEATVVRELTERRTENSTHWLMSDGTVKADITAVPTRFRDGSGEWVDIDPSLVLAEEPGTLETAATSMTVTFDDEDLTGAPVTITGDGTSLGLDMTGAAEGARIALGDVVRYLGVAVGVDLEYRTTDTGIKQTLVVKDASSPSTFDFAIDLHGLEVRQDPFGGYAFYRPGVSAPELRLGELVVFDSRADADSGPSYCPDAELTVTSGADGGTIMRLAVDSEWLSDPARVFPIMVDPTIQLTTHMDTSVRSEYPTTSYGANARLMTGNDTNGGVNRYSRAYVKAPGTEILEMPSGSYVASSALWVYQSLPHASGAVMRLGRIDSNWTGGSTWLTPTMSIAAYGSIYPSTSVGWVSVPCADQMQEWFDGTRTNLGLALYQFSTDTKAYREFLSNEYATAAYRPKWAVIYTDADATATIGTPLCRIDETQTANIDIATALPDDVNAVRVDVNGQGSSNRGSFMWSRTSVGTTWTPTALSGGALGYVSKCTTLSGAPMVSFLPSASSASITSGHFALNLAWKPNSDFVDLQDNDIDVTVFMDSDDGNHTNSRWNKKTTHNLNFDVAPAGPARSIVATTSASTSSGSWFVETDGNGDGIADNRNDSNSTGRGHVGLSWGAVSDAGAYDIELFDGSAYRLVDTVAAPATTWTSQGKNLFPSDSWIASNTAALAGGVNPFDSGTLDLRDDPRVLYAATPGTAYDDVRGYYFRVVPTLGTAGSGDLEHAEIVAVGLDDRTIGAYDDARHTEVGLDQSHGGALSLEADTGAFQIDATDLEIASWGPAADLSRHHSSQDAGSGSFAPGWRFGFERALQAASTEATYTDEAGDTHRFVRRAGVWTSPYGFDGSLVTGTATSTISWVSGETLTFDALGRLIEEADRNSNTVTFAYNAGDGDDVSITAANGRSILVERDVSGVVTRATQVADGVTRRVDYDGFSGTSGTASVVSFEGDPDLEKTVHHTYEAGRIVSISTPEDVRATWTPGYTGEWLTTLTAPQTADGTPQTTISTETVGACTRVTFTRTGRVNGAETAIEEHHLINPTGTEGSFAGAHVAGAAEPVSTTTYSPEGHEQGSTSASGEVSTVMVGPRGVVRRTRDERGAQTSTYYDSSDRPTSEIDERDALTTYAYDTRGNCTSETSDLNSTEDAHTDRAFDARGLCTSETVSLTAIQSVTTTRTFDACGEASGETVLGVELSPGASPVAITTTSAFDGFGQLLRSTDASGIVTASTRYDDAGRAVESTDAAGVATHTVYDALGRTISTWRSADGTDVKADWAEYALDGAGRVVTESRVLSTASSQSTESILAHTYDRMGREYESDDSKVSGEHALTHFDAAGNETAVWAEGVEDYDIKRASRTGFDLAGREVSRTEPGTSTASSTTTYLTGDLVDTETGADGKWTSYTYDQAGNKITETSSGVDDPATKTFTYDLGGRMVSETDADGVTTTHAYDLAGREVSAKGEGPASLTERNVRGETLSSTAADGVKTQTTFDAAGRTLLESVIASGAPPRITTTAYDAFGRVSGTTDPDGRTVTLGYDEFGRVDSEVHSTSAGEPKNVAMRFDSLGRTIVTTDAPDGVVRIVRSFGYNSDGSTTVTQTAGGVSTVLDVDARGRELSRASTWEDGTLTRAVTGRDIAERESAWSVAGQAYARDFDEAGRLSGWISPLGSMGIVYDAAGREASRTGDFGAVGFTYSDAGRLTGVDAPGTTGDSASAYSAAGNLETQTVGATTTVMSYEADSQRLVNRRVDGSVVATYTFDGLGQRIAQGPTSNKTAEVFGYTGTGRLASYTTSSGTSAAYSFDANGQRTRSEVRSDDVTATTDWTYEGLQLLALSASRSDGTTWAITYLYDSGGKPYAGVYRASDEETSTPFLMITNHRGDVLALTDTAGQRFASWTYDEWGVITTSTTEATGSITDSLAADIASRQPLRYAGYCYDTETSMYYCSARTYDPLTRQFLSKDPAKADGEESAYQYCSGNPVEKVDPTGCVVTYASAGWDDRKRFAVRGRLENLLPTEGMPSTLWVAFAAHVNIYYALLGPRVQGIKADWRTNGVWMYDTSTKKFCVRGMLNYLPMRPTTCFFYSGAVRLESWYEASGEWNRMESRNDYNPSKGVWYSYVRTSPWLRKCPTRVRVRITLTTIDGLGDVSETHRDTISKPSGVI